MNALLIWLECHWEWWLALGHVAGAHWLTLLSLLKIAWSTSQFGRFCGLSKSTWWTICHLPLEVPSLFCFPVWSSFSILLFLFGRFKYLGEFCFCFLATRRAGCSWVTGMHLDNHTLTLAILNLSCTVANNLLKKLAYKAEKYLSNRKHKDKQHVTQVLIEWKSGSDLVSLFTNGIKHIPCQKGYGSPPSHRITGRWEQNWKSKPWFLITFNYCDCVEG